MKQLSLIISIIAIFYFQLNLLAQNKYVIPILQSDPILTPSICMVSATPDNKTVVVWEKALNSFTNSFQIYRESTMQSGQYDLIGEVDYAGMSVFVDTVAEPAKQSYRYKISALDACGNETSLSSEHKTINLSILKGVNDSWSLIWDQYVGFPVSSYMIYRGSTPENLTLIGSATAGNFSFNDMATPSGYVYYQIEVISPYVCNPSGKKSTFAYSSTRSNIVSNRPLKVWNNYSDESDLRIYPNPGSNKTKVSFPNQTQQTYEITLFDLTGKIVLSESSNENQEEISLENCLDGIYILRVKGPKILWGKVVVNKEY